MTTLGKKTNQASRLAQLRKLHNLSTREVGRYIQRAPSQVLRYEAVETADIRDIVEKLATLYKVTADYILYGEGGPPSSVIELRRQVALQGISEMAAPEPPLRYRADDIEVVFARRVPVAARATFAENLADGGNMDEFEEVPIKNPTPELRRPGTLEVEVNGDSMEPTLRSGWSVACYPVDKADFKYLPGGIYAIVFGSFFVIKRIRDNNIIKDGTLTLYSDNDRGGTLTVPAEELRGIWKVVKVTDGLLH